METPQEYIDSINDANFDKVRKIPFYEVKGFENFLTKKAKKIYLNKSGNTVHEYFNVVHKLFKFIKFNINVDDLYVPFEKRKRIISLYEEKAKFKFIKSIGFEIERKAILIHYIALEATLNKEYSVDFYVKKIAKLFNYLAKKKVVEIASFQDVMIVPIAKKDKVVFNLWSGVRLSNNGVSDINKAAGIEVFVNEGDFIANFNWNLIDNLK